MFALVLTTVLTFRWEVLFIAFPKLVWVALSLSQPFLIQEAVSFVQSAETGGNDNVGYGLIGGFALVYTGLAVSTLSSACSAGANLTYSDHYGLVFASHLSTYDNDPRRPDFSHISKDATDPSDEAQRLGGGHFDEH